MSEYIFFWKEDKPNGYLSNWYPAKFNVGIDFVNSKQFLMFQKALLFKDKDAVDKIMDTSDPAKIKKYGREVKNFDEKVWNGYKKRFMLHGLYNKFSQNPELKEKLLATGDKILVEASPYDKVWGIGLGPTDNDRFDESKWKGENLLGQCLMEVRDFLRNY